MTLITAIATPYFISFVGDGRGVTGDNDEVVEEKLDKICRINDKIVIATAGNRTFNTKYIPEILANVDNKYNLSNVESFVESLFEVVGYNKTGFDYRLIIGGLNKDGDICFTHIDSTSSIKPQVVVLNEFSQRGTAANNSKHTYHFLVQPNDLLSARLNEALTTYEEYVNFNPEKAFAIQKQFNYDISQSDRTVNNFLTRDVVLREKPLLINA
ncbi:hypothetical protein LAV82_23735 [Bacillus sp. ILBB4]|nr:hypothetical protein [Bacillus sp. ILBB4]